MSNFSEFAELKKAILQAEKEAYTCELISQIDGFPREIREQKAKEAEEKRVFAAELWDALERLEEFDPEAIDNE